MMDRSTVCVNAIIKNDSRYLLIKRVKEPYKGMWSLPGGKLEAKETIKEGILREAKEETGLSCRFEKVNIVFHEMIEGKGDYVMFVCTLNSASSDFIESDEGKLEWFSKIPDDMIPVDKKVLEEYEDSEIIVPEFSVKGTSRNDFKRLC